MPINLTFREYRNYKPPFARIGNNPQPANVPAKEKIITVTKLKYGKPQPAILVFEDGKLKERVFIQ